MKKYITNLLITSLIICMSFGMAYAWYVVLFSGKIGASGIKPAEPATGILQFADQNVGTFSADLTVSATNVLYPCSATSSGWVNNVSQDVSNDANYVFKKSFYVQSGSTTQKLKVSSISVTGAGANDEITKSLRVMVLRGDTSYTYKAVGTNDYTKTFNGTSDTPSVLTIVIWYEGTDASNTSANALASTGEVKINITFEAE